MTSFMMDICGCSGQDLYEFGMRKLAEFHEQSDRHKRREKFYKDHAKDWYEFNG